MQKYAVVAISPPGYQHWRVFEEVRDALHFGILRAGHESVREINRFPAGYRPIILGANLLPPMSRLPPDSIVFNLEQIVEGSPWLTAHYVDLLRHYRVWDYSERNVSALHGLGVTKVDVVPLGYVPELSRVAPKKKSIDVLFYGSLNVRRETILKELHSRGADVKAVFGLYGAPRDELIAQSRIVINIHFYESRIFEIVRVGYLLANRAFVVSEESRDHEVEAQFKEGMVIAPYGDLVSTCMRFLSDESVRNDIAERGFKIFSSRDQSAALVQVLD